jgi:hypothetical protein
MEGKRRREKHIFGEEASRRMGGAKALLIK